MSEKDIRKLRGEIDTVDDELLALLQRRAGLARAVGKLASSSATGRQLQFGLKLNF